MSGDDPARRTDELLREYLRERDVSCAGCGYNLRNLTTGFCPECRVRPRLNVGKPGRSVAGFAAMICPICGSVCIGIVALVVGVALGLTDDVAEIVIVAGLDLLLLLVLVIWAPLLLGLRWWLQLAGACLSWAMHIVIYVAILLP